MISPETTAMATTSRVESAGLAEAKSARGSMMAVTTVKATKPPRGPKMKPAYTTGTIKRMRFML